MCVEIKINKITFIIEGDAWFRVLNYEKFIAHVTCLKSAYQVIYEDVVDNFGCCEYLNIEDFKEV